jgi:hypothetical protein
MKYLLIILITIILFKITITCKSSSFEIIEDTQLNEIIENTRKEFLSTRSNRNFNRLDLTILLPTENKNVWKKGSFGEERIAYPASCVKLPFMFR